MYCIFNYNQRHVMRYYVHFVSLFQETCQINNMVQINSYLLEIHILSISFIHVAYIQKSFNISATCNFKYYFF